ncbi:uncharacterized protein G2W53_000036 [Senna tora]|uniref:Uncharacterized protein n=1 Tax=Senna tora TaxID=362788 RepID=A0A835CHB9_9FABA|nr:uncharacterized protein G2W53_000036 [Senna tora]
MLGVKNLRTTTEKRKIRTKLLTLVDGEIQGLVAGGRDLRTFFLLGCVAL